MKHLEQDIQMAVVQWMRLQFPNLLFSISPGGLLTSGKVGNKANKLGYQKGVPDIMVFKANSKWHGLLIELKTPTGIISNEQKKYLAELMRLNYFAVVCRSFEEAKNTVEFYFSQ